MAIAATAWIGRDLSQLAAQPVVFGLAYLAFALAVAIRFGAIPFHVWAARLTDAVPETAPADRHRLGSGGVRDRRPRLDRRVGRAAPRSSSTPNAASSSPSRSPRSSWRRSRPGSRTTSSTSSATRSSATPASSCSRSRPSTRRPGRRPGPGSWRSSSPAARSRPGPPRLARPSGRAGSPTCAAGPIRSPVLALAFGLIVRRRRSACPGSPPSRRARPSSTSRSTHRSAVLVLVATLAPLVYYGAAPGRSVSRRPPAEVPARRAGGLARADRARPDGCPRLGDDVRTTNRAAIAAC